MWIIKQDGSGIVNLSNVKNIWEAAHEIEKFEIFADGISLGNYSTEKRAKSVIGDIISEIKFGTRALQMPRD